MVQCESLKRFNYYPETKSVTNRRTDEHEDPYYSLRNKAVVRSPWRVKLYTDV
jgi:hypothetical protein